MNGLSERIFSIEQATELLIQNTQQHKTNNSEPYNTFEDIFNQKIAVIKHEENADKTIDTNNDVIGNEVRFSKHANQRLESRNINLSQDQMTRLNNGISKARDKSINESLVMMDNLAFIVNVKNNTVITAVAGGEEKIFSNIDGAVVV